MSSAEARDFYDQQYAQSDYACVTAAEEHPYYPIVASFVRQYGLRSRRCLEIGCGRGAFQDLVDDYVGTDIANSAGRYAHKPFIQCDAAALPFEDSEFDAIWSVTVLEHVHEPEKALSEVRRVLQPGGMLLLAPAWHTRPWFAQGYPARRYRDLDWTGKLAKLSIPFRDSLVARYPRILVRRCIRYVGYLAQRGPVPFRYRRLSSDYGHYWMADSDAVNSMDPFDAILWFRSRGDVCKSHPTATSQLLVRSRALVFQVLKDQRSR